MMTGALLLAAAPPSFAALCSVSVSVLAFGIYDTLLPNANDTAGTVQVACIPGVAQPLTTAYTITIAGTGAGADTVRAIVSGSYRLRYQIYKDAARTIVWGNGSTSGAGVASSVTSTAALVPAAQTHTAYARMPALQTVPPGIYAGSLLVTVDY